MDFVFNANIFNLEEKFLKSNIKLTIEQNNINFGSITFLYSEPFWWKSLVNERRIFQLKNLMNLTFKLLNSTLIYFWLLRLYEGLHLFV